MQSEANGNITSNPTVAANTIFILLFEDYALHNIGWVIDILDFAPDSNSLVFL